MRRALEVSLLLHLVLLFIILPRARALWPNPAAAPLFAAAPAPAAEPRPIEFEFVDLAEEREEAPASNQVPLSDLDRRAHGGAGDASSRPSSRGTTNQLVQADAGEVLDHGTPPRRPVPRPVEQPREPSEERPEQAQPVAPEQPAGAGDEQSPQPPVKLPPRGAWASPPAPGGLPENPDRDGGLVDASGLSFDTQWYDWGAYAKAMLAKIRRHWRIPEIARLGVGGVVKIRYFIERDGSISGLTILDESGKPPMDFAARDAIAHASPFEALPPDLPGDGREGVTITFYYNMQPPERGSR